MRYRYSSLERSLFRAVLLPAVAVTSWAQTAMFTPISSIQVGDKFASPMSVAVADVNGDRIPDILTAATDGIHVLLAGGEGRFELSQMVVSGNFVRIVTADFNHDGFVDVAAGSNSVSTTVLLGDGTGKFRTSARLPGVGYGAADLNGDGNIDLSLLWHWFGVAPGPEYEGAHWRGDCSGSSCRGARTVPRAGSD